MPQLSSVIKAYVGSRWPFQLVQTLVEGDETKAFVRREILWGDAPMPSDWSKAVHSSPLSRYIGWSKKKGRASDTDFDDAANWRKRIDRWLKESVAPTPEMMRRTLVLLKSDWLLGLGSAGYFHHAIALMHELWKGGHRTDAADYALAILGEDSAAAARIRRPVSPNRETRASNCDDALRAVCRTQKGAVELPTAISRPIDLSDELLVIWSMISAMQSEAESPQTYERSVNALKPQLSELAKRWARRVRPTRARLSKSAT